MNEINLDLQDLSNELKRDYKKLASTKKYPTYESSLNPVTKNDVMVHRLANEFDYDPVAELVKLARSAKTTPDLKMRINMELLTYCIPKLKPIDTNPNQGETIAINVIMPH